MIKYWPSKPSLHEYRLLFESTSWILSISISDDIFQKAMDNSWYWTSVFDNEKLIGIGRLISDGVLYAFVCDMIVLHAYQKRGIGSAILRC